MVNLTIHKRDFLKKFRATNSEVSNPKIKFRNITTGEFEFVSLSTEKSKENPNWCVIINGVKHYPADISLFNFERIINDFQKVVKQDIIPDTIVKTEIPDNLEFITAVYHENTDRIYAVTSGIPYNKVLIINPNNSEFDFIESIDSDSPSSIVTHMNGMIYLIPYGSGKYIFEIDPINHIQVVRKKIRTTDATLFKSCVHPNGKIYIAPGSETDMFIYDPITNNIDRVVVSTSTTKYGEVVVGNDECIYFFNKNITNIMKLNPKDGMITYIPNSFKNTSAVQVFGDKIYAVPDSSTSSAFFELDVKTETITSLKTGFTSNNIKMFPDGYLYVVSLYENSVRGVFLKKINMDDYTIDTVQYHSSNTYLTTVNKIINTSSGKVVIVPNTKSSASGTGTSLIFDFKKTTNICLVSPYYN